MEGNEFEFNHDNKGSLQARFDAYCKKVIYHSVYNTVNKQTAYLMRNWKYSGHMEDGVQEDIDVDPDVTRFSIKGEIVEIHDEELAEVILTLQKRKREIVLMNEMLGYSLSEIADELGISYESVKSAKSKAFREMRKGAGKDRNGK